jgi:hypothetical protein
MSDGVFAAVTLTRSGIDAKEYVGRLLAVEPLKVIDFVNQPGGCEPVSLDESALFFSVLDPRFNRSYFDDTVLGKKAFKEPAKIACHSARK